MEDNNSRKEDYLHAVWFAAGMAVLMACFERAVIVSIFEQWRVWVFLVLNLLLLAILFTSTCSSTVVESKADDEKRSNDLAELKIEVVEEDEARGGGREERECGGGGGKDEDEDEDEDEEWKSKEELNERVEAFIAMFRQHLVSDAKGTSGSSFCSISRTKDYPNLIAPRVRVHVQHYRKNMTCV